MYVPEILQNRSYLLTIIALITTISALGPFFVAEITPTLAAHASLHIAAITFGVFLFILSIMAYKTTNNSNMIFTAFAFATFTMLSIFLLEEDLISDHMQHNEAIWVDVLLTLMIGFFGIGVFSNQKFKGKTNLI
tara:strand:- start:66 stop:470 length:405 start_codon:yes stop_codon:yes gene_type:complete